jgi:cell division ATPase FtsA
LDNEREGERKLTKAIAETLHITVQRADQIYRQLQSYRRDTRAEKGRKA